MALKVVDRAIQVHGAEGISQDQPLAYFYASLRTLKFADVSPWSSSSCSSSYCSVPHLIIPARPTSSMMAKVEDTILI